MLMMTDLEQVDVLSTAAAQGGHVAAGVEGGGVSTHGVRAPAHGALVGGYKMGMTHF